MYRDIHEESIQSVNVLLDDVTLALKNNDVNKSIYEQNK